VISPEVCDDGDIDGTSNCKADCSGPVNGWSCYTDLTSDMSICNTIC